MSEEKKSSDEINFKFTKKFYVPKEFTILESIIEITQVDYVLFKEGTDEDTEEDEMVSNLTIHFKKHKHITGALLYKNEDSVINKFEDFIGLTFSFSESGRQTATSVNFDHAGNIKNFDSFVKCLCAC